MEFLGAIWHLPFRMKNFYFFYNVKLLVGEHPQKISSKNISWESPQSLPEDAPILGRNILAALLGYPQKCRKGGIFGK